MPLAYKLGGGFAVVLLLTAVFGYGPYMRWSLTRTLETAEDAGSRAAAAEALYNRNDAAAYSIFQQRLASPDEKTRTAAVHGMSLFAVERDGNGAIKEIGAAMPALDPAGKAAFCNELKAVAKTIAESKRDETEQAKSFALLGQAMLPLLASDNPNVLGAAVQALVTVRAPGVCSALVDVALNAKDASHKAAARDGLQPTALPDAVPALLKAMASSDSELSQAARIAFARVRDTAPSAALLPLLADPNAAVRKAIVEALGRRHGDAQASEGITKALADTTPELRILALKSIPVCGVSGSTSQLLAVLSDPIEDVRVACAQTLGALHDDDSRKTLLEAFGTNPSGETMAALLEALRKRSGQTKDIGAIGIVMALLEKDGATPGVVEALAALTNAGQGAQRDAERKQWSAERWKAWWANIAAREKVKTEAMDKLTKADARKQEDKKIYPTLLQMTIEGLDLLEKCKEMSKNDDKEDIAWFDKTQSKYSMNRELFFKHQSIDIRNLK
jgi:HEAT repeat protein